MVFISETPASHHTKHAHIAKNTRTARASHYIKAESTCKNYYHEDEEEELRRYRRIGAFEIHSKIRSLGGSIVAIQAQCRAPGRSSYG